MGYDVHDVSWSDFISHCENDPNDLMVPYILNLYGFCFICKLLALGWISISLCRVINGYNSSFHLIDSWHLNLSSAESITGTHYK